MAKRPSRGVTSGIGKPMKLSGRDGDLTIRKTHDGKILYVKDHGDWHQLTTGIDTAQLKKDVDRLINSVNAMQRDVLNPYPNKRKLTLSHADGTGVSIKNSSGVLKVRNAADSADALLKAKRLQVEVATEGTTNAVLGEIQYDTSGTSFIAHARGLVVSPVTIGSSGDNCTIMAQSYASDARFVCQDAGSAKWVFGYDQAVSSGTAGLFKINNGSTLDDSSKFALDTSGNLTLAGGLTSSGVQTIDRNNTATTTSTTKGLHIDYDHTGISASGQTITGIGLDLDMNCETVTHVGTVTQTGIDIDMVAATDGSQTNLGMDINVSGGDKNYGLWITVPDGAYDNHIKLIAADDSSDYATLNVADTGDLTIATVGNGTTDSDITLDADGGLYLDADNGEARLTNGGGTFTPLHAADIATKKYVDDIKHTAVWGGNLARIPTSGTWYGIPTGYQALVVSMGTGITPDTSFTLSTSADDLVSVIWASMHDVTVTGCKIWVGQGGATNTPSNVALMRYDIDADGDLSNGVVVGSGGTLNNDDYTQARAYPLTLSGTAANLDVDFSGDQILIAFVEPASASNAALGAKVILEYTEVET